MSDFGDPMDCTCPAPPFMGFSKQNYCSRLLFPSPDNLMKWILFISLTFHREKFRHKKCQLPEITELVRGEKGLKHRQPISRVHMISYGKRCQIHDLQRRKFSFGTREQACPCRVLVWQFYYSEKGQRKLLT